ncbi:MAG: glycoside hydrolase family 3 C-terminal domain-containing protein [Caldilineaceae bacterium]|nr:glycoside hydrolase family 3 C-terminal domain-containing protein [Caldilineaceae bacterium]
MTLTTSIESRIDTLLAQMTLAEKIGQMWQISGKIEDAEAIVRRGGVGSFLNVIGEDARELQRIAVEESRLGIPLLFGRDVIHGFRTIFPIPLGQAATFDPQIVREGARVAAREAAALELHWTFTPMLDIARDPRWGRIAEGCGEDPYLTAQMGVAMVEGFQGEDLGDPERIAACLKHYVGYSAAEGGRDYNTTWIPEGLLRDVYLPPFHAGVKAGAATLMSAFNDLNGIPTSGNAFTLRQILRDEWGFDGMVVSDWNSVIEMIPHGFAADEKDAAAKAIAAGVDMEMVSHSYVDHVESLIAEGVLSPDFIDAAVRAILRLKFRLGLFERPINNIDPEGVLLAEDHLRAARIAARESCVLLKNESALPLDRQFGKLAVVGPLADSGDDQLGCWAFDGRSDECRTPLAALREALGADRIIYHPGLPHARSHDTSGLPELAQTVGEADAIVLFVGEEAILSGEAHSRAFLDLPGAQEALIDVLSATGKPLIAVVMAGRSLVLSPILDKVDALLYAWHPGTMGGPAIADLLLGEASPSGRLPVTFPRSVGQIPLYYNYKNTGRPTPDDAPSIPTGTPLDPKNFTAGYLDVDHRPLFPFGYGLTYTTFEYSDLRLSTMRLGMGETLTATATLTNTGTRAATEVVQIYVRDLVGSVTRPIRELKGFQRVDLAPGASQDVTFTLHTDDLAFHNAAMQRITEPGKFHLWIAPHAADGLRGEFEIGRSA